MKVTAKVKQEISNCYVMAARLQKLHCAVNSAYKNAVRGDGRAIKHELIHVVEDAYQLGMMHPSRKVQFDHVAKELRAIQRHSKDALTSAYSRQKMALRLVNVESYVLSLKIGIKARCYAKPPFQGSHPAD